MAESLRQALREAIFCLERIDSSDGTEQEEALEEARSFIGRIRRTLLQDKPWEAPSLSAVPALVKLTNVFDNSILVNPSRITYVEIVDSQSLVNAGKLPTDIGLLLRIHFENSFVDVMENFKTLKELIQ